MEYATYLAGAKLAEIGLLGLLITMPLALLLGLGLKHRGRSTTVAGGGMMFSLGTAILGLTMQGIFDGEVFAFSRSTLTVSKLDQPIFFQVSAFAFLGVSVLLIAFGVYLVSLGVRTRTPHA